MNYNIKATILLTALLLLVTITSAQDPIKLAPKMHKLLLENESVRVFEFKIQPGEKLAMHSHPNQVIYALSGGKLKFTLPDGKMNELDVTPGMVKWMDPVTHEVENIGKSEIKIVDFELKYKK